MENVWEAYGGAGCVTNKMYGGGMYGKCMGGGDVRKMCVGEIRKYITNKVSTKCRGGMDEKCMGEKRRENLWGGNG